MFIYNRYNMARTIGCLEKKQFRRCLLFVQLVIMELNKQTFFNVTEVIICFPANDYEIIRRTDKLFIHNMFGECSE